MSDSPCPSCAKPVPTGARFCPSCGYAVPQSVFCTACGTRIPQGGRFCVSCGTATVLPAGAAPDLEAPRVPSPPPVPPPAPPPVPPPAPSSKAAPTPKASDTAKLPKLKVRGGWMMLFAGTFAVAATVYYQTTIILWELAIGGPLLITAALFMLILSGSGRYLAALLALACGAWGYWQLHTYLPLFPEMLEKSWPLFGFLPAATVLAILAAVRCLRSLISPPYVFVAGQAPRRRYAILGILFAYVILGCIAGLSFLPDSVRRPMLRDMWGRYSYDPPTESTPQSVTQTPSPEATPETAQEAKLPEKIQIVQAPGYDLNPVLPPMNSQASTDQPLGSSSYATSVSQVTPPAKKTTRVPTNAREPAPLAKTELTKIAKSPVSSSAALTAPTQPARKVEDGFGQSPATSPILSKGTTGSVKTAATVSPATKKQGPALPVTEPNIMDTALPAFGTPKAYSGLADSLSESPVLNDVSFAETGGQTELSIKSDQKILQRQANPDGTELLRVRYSTELRDIQGRKSQGYLLLDVLMDGKGRVLRSLPVEMSDSETDLFAAMP